MDIRVHPGRLRGIHRAVPSKSQAHRFLILSALCREETRILCGPTGRDVEATIVCLEALGANIQRLAEGFQVTPIRELPKKATLPCGESGSTARFLLPIVGALGVEGEFWMEGRLAQRPFSPLWEEMQRMGCRLSRPTENSILCQGKLRNGAYAIGGGVSSQFITGLMLALPLLDGPSTLTILGKTESRPYIHMTRQGLQVFGMDIGETIAPQVPVSPGCVAVEGDWSSAAFFLAAGTQAEGLMMDSLQGDRAIYDILPSQTNYLTVDAGDIPDLVPILAVVAARNMGGEFHDIQRLRLKESDRVEAISEMLRALGIRCEATDTTLRVFPGKFSGGMVDPRGDHRIAMAAAIAATFAQGPVDILGADCAAKSYPGFWEEFTRLGGHYELLLR